jgi:hypothetical protein
VKTVTGAASTPWARRRRETPAKSRITGATDGTIMAIIMTIHMSARLAISSRPQGEAIGIGMPA